MACPEKKMESRLLIQVAAQIAKEEIKNDCFAIKMKALKTGTDHDAANRCLRLAQHREDLVAIARHLARLNKS